MPSARATDVRAHFGANLRLLRRERGRTQAQLAELLDIDVRYVQRLEAGGVDVGIVALARIARMLEVTPGRLLRQVRPVSRRPGRPRMRRGS